MSIYSNIFATAGVVPGVLKWQTITANQTLAVDNGFIVTSGALSLALPTSSNVGDMIAVMLVGGISFSITQAAGQQIRLNNQQTTSGVNGSLNSTNNGNSVVLICDTANTHWTVLNYSGTLTVV